MAKRKKKSSQKNSGNSVFFRTVCRWTAISFLVTLLLIGGCITYQTTHPASARDHLALGTPGKADRVLKRDGYALGYSVRHRQPTWVIYELFADDLKGERVSRTNVFVADGEVPGKPVTPEDYKKSGFDRGHLAPAADMAYSEKTMKESFLMSNMSPQRPEFNRDVWKDLESQVRVFALEEKDIYVVTGPVLPENPTLCIGADRDITVPDAYYKVVYDRTPPEKMIGFIVPNAGSNQKLADFAVTVDAVEAATGLDFFSELPKDKQEKLESTITVSDWKWQKFKNR